MTDRHQTRGGVIHVTATQANGGLTMAKLDAMHKARGWTTVGYNMVVFQDHRIELSPRGWNGVGAHVAGFNSIYFGLSMEGGIDKAGRPDFSTVEPLLPTLMKAMRMVEQKFGRIPWCGHRDLSPDKDGDGIIEPYEYLKACPTFDVIPWAETNGFLGMDIKGTWDSGPAMPGSKTIVFQGPDSRYAYLQRLLLRAGYQFGPVDGIAGKKTALAITKYQTANDLPPTGEFDEVTVARLRSAFEH